MAFFGFCAPARRGATCHPDTVTGTPCSCASPAGASSAWDAVFETVASLGPPGEAAQSHRAMRKPAQAIPPYCHTLRKNSQGHSSRCYASQPQNSGLKLSTRPSHLPTPFGATFLPQFASPACIPTGRRPGAAIVRSNGLWRNATGAPHLGSLAPGATARGARRKRGFVGRRDLNHPNRSNDPPSMNKRRLGAGVDRYRANPARISGADRR